MNSPVDIRKKIRTHACTSILQSKNLSIRKYPLHIYAAMQFIDHARGDGSEGRVSCLRRNLIKGAASLSLTLKRKKRIKSK